MIGCVALVALLALAARGVEAQEAGTSTGHCALKPEWKVTINCDEGSVQHVVDRGIVLSCPKGIAPNTIGAMIQSDVEFPAFASGAIEVEGFTSGLGSRVPSSAQPYVGVSYVANDNAKFEAVLANWGDKNNLNARYMSASGAVLKEETRSLDKEDDTLLVKIDRGDGELEPTEAKATVHTFLEELTVAEDQWTAAPFKAGAFIGNSGAAAALQPVEVTLAQFQDADGNAPLKTMLLCTLYGEATYPPTPSPTPPTTLKPTPAPVIGASSTTGQGEGCPARCPAPESIECEETQVALSPGKDDCGCDEPLECVFRTVDNSANGLILSMFVAALLSIVALF